MLDSQKKANAKYLLKCDAITIRPPMERGQAYREAAAAAGQSLTAYIMAALAAYAGQQGSGQETAPEPVKASQPDEQSAAAWYKPGAVLYIPVGSKTAAALERVARAGESPLQCAARLLGDAIKAAPVGENGHGAPKGAGK